MIKIREAQIEAASGSIDKNAICKAEGINGPVRLVASLML